MEQEEIRLSKKERKLLKKQKQAQAEESQERKQMIIKWGSIVAIIFLCIGLLWWLFSASSKPLPGQSVADLGRKHAPDGTKVQYNSNPPTSGDHYADWTKAGIYDKPVSDGHLVHSLEHGYIIISYNCEKKLSTFSPRGEAGHFQLSTPKAYAHEENLSSTPSAEASSSGELKGDAWNSQACKDLKKQLSDIAKEKRVWKLIVIPRPNLDVPIALTAWTRIDKMEKVDKDRISSFIDAYRDHGPEKTMEL